MRISAVFLDIALRHRRAPREYRLPIAPPPFFFFFLLAPFHDGFTHQVQARDPCRGDDRKIAAARVINRVI